jgi:hypothetical protein
VSNLPFRSGASTRSVIGSPGPRQHPWFGQQPVSGQLSTEHRRRSRSSSPGFLLSFGRRHSLLGPSCSHWGAGPSSQSAYPTQAAPGPQPGLPRSTRVRSDRGVDALFIPRRWCSPAWGPTPYGTCHFSAASPVPRCFTPSCEADGDETPSRVHSRSPARSSPGLSSPDGTGTLGPSPDASHPAVTRDARQGRRQALSTGLELHLRHRRTSNRCDHSQRATSCRTGGSAPSTPSAGIGPIPVHLPGGQVRAGAVVESSHVHCCPVDRHGARFAPAASSTATPWTFTATSQARPVKPSREFPRRKPQPRCAPLTSPHSPD